ncbi:MAG: hypothetical protein RSA00_02950 [Hydrogenoanaerobacterium sp.]
MSIIHNGKSIFLFLQKTQEKSRKRRFRRLRLILILFKNMEYFYDK